MSSYRFSYLLVASLLHGELLLLRLELLFFPPLLLIQFKLLLIPARREFAPWRTAAAESRAALLPPLCCSYICCSFPSYCFSYLLVASLLHGQLVLLRVELLFFVPLLLIQLLLLLILFLVLFIPSRSELIRGKLLLLRG
jgi:hypothetical protein